MKLTRNKDFLLAALTLLMAGAIFFTDLITALGMGEFFLYILPMILTIKIRWRSYSLVFGAICTVFTIVGFFFPTVPVEQHIWQMALLRRVIGLSVLWVTAIFIVQRKEAEAALVESQSRFRLFMNNTTAVAWMKDQGFKYVYVNAPFERSFYKTMGDFVNKTDFEVWPEDVARALRSHDEEVLRTWKQIEVYETVPDATGQKREWLVHKFPFIDVHGRKFVGGIAMDATERRLADELVRNSERRFRSVWDNSADGMRLTDKDGNIVAANPAFCRLVEIERSELEGKPLSVTHSTSTDKVLERYCARFETRSIEPHLERRVAFKSGRTVDLEVSSSFVELEHQPPLLLSIFRDVTERKQHERQRLALERKLLDSQKLESLGILAGGIAHDFNNLLTGILGNAGLTLMQLPETSPVRPQLSNIEKICLQAADLCKQMLAYSGRGRFVIQKLNLNNVVEEMTQLLRISIPKKITLQFDFAPSLPLVEADASQIRQVLMNLIINGAEAIGENAGVIKIRTGAICADHSYLADSHSDPGLPEGEYVYLEVADTGCGMSPETQAKIFDPFFSTKFTGRGLGLAAVLGIMRGHKGGLRVYNEMAVGSTFKFFLPRATASSLEAVESAVPRDWRGEGTVLIVDDEEHVRAVTGRMLEAFGFMVMAATDGRQGIEMFRAWQDKITLVLLDMTMPNLNGEEAFREIRRMHSSVPVLLMSGYNEQDLTSRFVGRGLDGFLQKPFKPEELRDKLRDILEKKAL